MQRLVLLEGNAQPAEISLDGPVLVGRTSEADVRLFDETASRRHARLRPEEERVLLEDLGSANGTLLNGEPVGEPTPLYHGDVIAIGSVRLRYLSGEGADRETALVAEPEGRVEASVDPEAADPAAQGAGEGAVRRLRLVCDGARACAEAADPAQVPAALLDLVVEALSPDRAVVLLRAPSGGLRVAAAHPAGGKAPHSRTLQTRVLEAGEAVLVRDGAAEPSGTSASLLRSRFRCTLAAPLRTAEGVLGLVLAQAEAQDRYGPQDLHALAAAAQQAALALRNLQSLSAARAEARRLGAPAPGEVPPLLGGDPALLEVHARIAKAADVDTPVLITGETGTGKELVARHLHAGSSRRREPFVALNCAGLVEGLLESELFGHERGAFTGATERRPGHVSAAGRGTLFLDEVGDLPLALQGKLLRVLSEGTYLRVGGTKPQRMRCRLLAATNRDLRAMVEQKEFREDLYFRLAVLEIRLPPLRERAGDVEELAEAGLERLASRLGRRVPRLAADARDALRRYPWPGNVRELFNVLERALVLLEGDTITALDLPVEVREGRARVAAGTEGGEVLTIREAERRAVAAALRATGWRKGRAAQILGISWPTLNRKIREYGLAPEGEAAD